MATRGTYRIDNFLCYNHWDNYPEGTAFHLLEVIKKYGAVDLFSCIRGMEGLQPAQSIYDGPAEWYYELKAGKITVFKDTDPDQKRYVEETDIDKWITRQMTDFFKQHPDELTEGETLADYTVIKYAGRYTTPALLHQKGRQEWREAGERHRAGHIGNASSQYLYAFKMLNTAGLPFDDLIEQWPPIAEQFAKSYGHESAEHFLNYVTECEEAE